MNLNFFFRRNVILTRNSNKSDWIYLVKEVRTFFSDFTPVYENDKEGNYNIHAIIISFRDLLGF